MTKIHGNREDIMPDNTSTNQQQDTNQIDSITPQPVVPDAATSDDGSLGVAKKTSTKKMGTIIFSIVLLFVLIGAGVWAYVNNKNTGPSEPAPVPPVVTETPESTESTQTTEVSEVETVTDLEESLQQMEEELDTLETDLDTDLDLEIAL